MATKKDSIDSVLDSIEKKFGLGDGARPIIFKGDALPDINYIPTSYPSIGYILGTGGWPEGKLVELFGQESSGKTSVAVLACIDVLNHYKDGRKVLYIDIEHRANPDWLRKLGMDIANDLILVQPVSAEDAFDIMADLIKTKQICAIIFDSIGAASTLRDTSNFADKNTLMGGSASVMSRGLKTINSLMSLYNVSGFFINQLRDDMEGYHRPVTPGGRQVKHLMSVRIYLRPGKDKFYEKDDEAMEVGHAIVAKVLKNSFAPAPRESWFNFYTAPSATWLPHVGIDIDEDLQRMGLMLGLVTRGGAWYEWEGIKGQGRDNFFAALEESGRKDEYIADVHEALAKKRITQIDEFVRPEALGVEIDRMTDE